MSHTYVLAKVSPETYGEIRKILQANGYSHAFHEDHCGEVIDMHGIALSEEKYDRVPDDQRRN